MKRSGVGSVGVRAGLAGSLLIGLGSLAAALAYQGRDGQPYSPLNHWVSELGQLGVSELAGVFNAGLMLGGLCFALFMSILGWVRRGRLALLYAPVGVVTGVAGFFVGAFPMNQLEEHGLAALTFFNAGWIAVGLASLDFYVRPEPRFPRWLAVIGAATVVAFAGFLIVLTPLLGGDGLAAPEIRPDVWIVPILEWAVLLGILLWVFATALTWWRGERADQRV